MAEARGSEATVILTGLLYKFSVYAPVDQDTLRNSQTAGEPGCTLLDVIHASYARGEKYRQTLRRGKGTAEAKEERQEAAPSEEGFLFDAEFSWEGGRFPEEEEGYEIFELPAKHIYFLNGQIARPMVAQAVKRHAVTLGLSWDDAAAHLPQLLADLPPSAPLRYVVLLAVEGLLIEKEAQTAVIDALACSPQVVGVYIQNCHPILVDESAISRICRSITYLAIVPYPSADESEDSFARSVLQIVLNADSTVKQLYFYKFSPAILDNLRPSASNCSLTRVQFQVSGWNSRLFDLLGTMKALTDVGLMITELEQLQLLLRSELHTRIFTLRLVLFLESNESIQWILRGLMDRACTIQFLQCTFLPSSDGNPEMLTNMFALLARSDTPVRLAALSLRSPGMSVTIALIAGLCEYLCAPAARELVHLELRLRPNGRPDIQTAAEWKLAKSLSNNFTLCHLGFNWKSSAAETCAISQLQRNKLYRATNLVVEEPVSPNLAKLFVCGHPEVGKTTLSRALRLLQNPSNGCFLNCKRSPDRTRGMETHPLTFRGRDSKFMIFDLAGQEEYHVFHHYFMNSTNNDIFMVVCKYEDSSSDELFKRQLEYWLRFVVCHKSTRTKKSLTGRSLNETECNPKIIVVVNFFGPIKGEETMKRIASSWTSVTMGRFSEVLDIDENQQGRSLFWVNAKTGVHVQQVYERLESFLENFSTWPVPKLCYDVLTHITKGEGGSRWFCTNCVASKPKLLTTFSAIHEAWNNNSTIERAKIGAVLQELHAQGYVIYFPSQDSSDGHGISRRRTKVSASEDSTKNELVIVDTNWFSNKLIGSLLGTYMVSPGTAQWKWSKDGIVQLLRKQGCHEGHLEEILRYLLKLELCVALDTALSGEDVFLFPALCKDKAIEYPRKSMEKSTKFFGRRKKCKDLSTCLIPFAVFTRLQVKLYKAYSAMNHTLKYGYGWISFMRGRVGVVVRFGVDVSTEAWENKQCVDILIFCLADSCAESSKGSSIKHMDDPRLIDAEKLVHEIRNHFEAACDGDGIGGIPTVEMEEMVLENAEKDSDAIPLAHILDKVKTEGLLDSYQEWESGIFTRMLELLLPAEIRGFVEGELSALQRIEEEFCTEMGDGGNIKQLEQDVETSKSRDSAIFNLRATGDPVMIETKINYCYEEIRGLHRKMDKMDEVMQMIREDISKLPDVIQKEADRIITNCSTRLLRHELRKDRAYPLYPYLVDADGKLAVLGNAVGVRKKVRVHFMCESKSGLHPVAGQKGREVTAHWATWVKRAVRVMVPAVKILCCMARVAAAVHLPMALPAIPTPEALATLLSGLGIDRGALQEVIWPNALEALLGRVADVKWKVEMEEKEVQKMVADLLRHVQDLDMRSDFGLIRVISEEDGRCYWVCERHASGCQRARVDHPNPYTQ